MAVDIKGEYGRGKEKRKEENIFRGKTRIGRRKDDETRKKGRLRERRTKICGC